MLRELRIENIAIIEKAAIQFGPGLNVLTGETGAGKSIIIDSIAAATGARVGRDLIRTGAERAIVTAVFDLNGAEDWLNENEIDCDDEVILQRRINSDGKSSCRVCGCPVTAGQLRQLGSLLLELHGQNDGLQLLDERRHLLALDRFAGLNLDDYHSSYKSLLDLQEERARLSMDETEKELLQERLSETVQELEHAQLRQGEYDELSKRRDLLRNSEKLTESLMLSLNALNGEAGVLQGVQDALWNCRKASTYSSELNTAADKLDQALFMLSDAEETIRDFQETLNYSPDEYDQIENRLHELSRLERKYRKNVDELPQYLIDTQKRLNEISFSDALIEELDRKIREKENQCRELSHRLHQQREKAAELLSARIEQELQDLSMPGSVFLVELKETTSFMADGTDTARFLISANRGETPGRISHIASGGELSRIMLALMNVFSDGDPVPTMVFDEIDTGVSGIAAQRVGEKLALLSRNKQVLCVTHLPQLASLADTHFVISKEISGQRTNTRIVSLDREGRRQELARLHGGDNITMTTLNSAEEQLRYADSFKIRHSGK